MAELNVTFGTSIRLIDTIFIIYKVRCHIESGHSRAIIEYRLLQVRLTWDELETETVSLDSRDCKVEVTCVVIGTVIWVKLGLGNTSAIRNHFKYCKCFLLNWNAIHDMLRAQGYWLVVLETILSFKWAGNCKSLWSYQSISLSFYWIDDVLPLSPIELPGIVCIYQQESRRNY
jgi:hypothetical protein